MTYKIRNKPYLIIMLSFFLSACISQPSPPIIYGDKHSPQWQQQLQQLDQIKQYHTSGQLGYISPKERFSTHFDWQFINDQNYQLHLSSALNTFSLTFRMTPQGLLVTDHKGNSRISHNAQTLLTETVGIEFPLELFSYWLKGQPQGANNYKISQNNLLAELDYNLNGHRWQASYLEYFPSPLLPKNIIIHNGQQQLKVRIDEWKF